MTSRKNILVWRILIWSANRILAFKNHYYLEPVELKPPFLLISNHVSDADGMALPYMFKKEPAVFVGSEHIVRIRFLGKILTDNHFLIPIKKGNLSLSTVKDIVRNLKEGKAVVLFAEGDCTWNGVSSDIFPATGKLVKLMKCPLVTYRIEGGYFAGPRWADKRRKGNAYGKTVGIYSPDELAGMSPEEINRTVNRDIYFNHYEWENDETYKSKAYAKGLHKALFICPKCKKAGTLDSRKHEIFCKECGMRARTDGRGRTRFVTSGTFNELNAQPDSGSILNIYDWDRWQIDRFKEMILEADGGCDEKDILFSFEGRLTCFDDGKSQTVRCSLDIGKNAIIAGDREFLFSEISDMAAAQTTRLLFTAGKEYYEIFIKEGVIRPYLLAWQIFNLSRRNPSLF